ncbi:hypothetical protein OEA41_003205 [Lepraria neglecta]|uniref:Uncharacterized protein n=1 Tax=Lepraria neglecta TaxID=209136 RepID=A0AAD9Z482_9LECA|nr:hypothetical protein OEA41_003205 [Lepraria neglecta]
MFPHPLFCLKRNSDKAEIVSILQDGVQETINQFLDLASSCTQPPQPRNGEKQIGLRYHDKGEAHLRVKDLSVKYDIEELRESHFSQEKLLPEDLCPTLGFDHPAMRPLKLFSVQANFVKNGLLLIVCMYHSICDSVGQFHVTEMLASQCNAIGQRKATSPSSSLKLAFSANQFDRSRLFHLFHGAPKSDVAKLSSYIVLPVPERGMPAWATPDGKPLATKKPSSSTEPYISTHDAVCALVWRTVIAARLKASIITTTDASTFGMPIDGRSQLSPPLPADFLRNLAVCFKVGESVQELIPPENLGAAGFQIRSGVKSVDDAYLKNFVTLLQEVPDMGQVFIDCLEHIKTTGLFLTSWARFDYAGLSWGSRFGECEIFRFPAGGYMNGIAVIFPPLTNGDWEVTLTLEETAMKAFKEDETWRRFARME